jgi:hypothetical protein
MLVFADPKEWWIELPSPPASNPTESDRSTPWRSLAQSHPGRQWDAYLSKLCLQYLVPWLQDTYGGVQPWLAASDWPAIWEVVGGCAVRVGDRRLILIPSDGLEGDGLVVAQEWVDLPDWAGDYYMAVQFCSDAEAQGLRVWGYASHQILKAVGDYDDVARTYALDAIDLEQDMSTFEVIQQCCPDVQTRSEIAPLTTLTTLTTLPAVQADHLIDRLGNPDLLFPRLAIPFATWGTLIQNPTWRQQLYRQRQGQQQNLVEASIVQLSQWLNGVLDSGWQSLESLVGASLTPQLRRLEPNAWDDRSLVKRAKVISVSQNQTVNSVAIVLLVNPLPSETVPTVQVQVQLHPLQTNVLPAHISLELHDPQSQTCLQTVQSQTDNNYIQLGRFRATVGESFQIQIKTTDTTLVETFLV